MSLTLVAGVILIAVTPDALHLYELYILLFSVLAAPKVSLLGILTFLFVL